MDLFERLLDVIGQLTKSAVHFVEIFAIIAIPVLVFGLLYVHFQQKGGEYVNFYERLLDRTQKLMDIVLMIALPLVVLGTIFSTSVLPAGDKYVAPDVIHDHSEAPLYNSLLMEEPAVSSPDPETKRIESFFSDAASFFVTIHDIFVSETQQPVANPQLFARFANQAVNNLNMQNNAQNGTQPQATTQPQTTQATQATQTTQAATGATEIQTVTMPTFPSFTVPSTAASSETTATQPSTHPDIIGPTVPPTVPTGTVKPTKSTDPSAHTDPSGSTHPSGCTNPSGCTHPSGCTNPSCCTHPSGCTNPSGCTHPSGCTNPSCCTHPSGITNPSGSTNSSGITHPSGSTNPSASIGTSVVTEPRESTSPTDTTETFGTVNVTNASGTAVSSKTTEHSIHGSSNASESTVLGSVDGENTFEFNSSAGDTNEIPQPTDTDATSATFDADGKPASSLSQQSAAGVDSNATSMSENNGSPVSHSSCSVAAMVLILFITAGLIIIHYTRRKE